MRTIRQHLEKLRKIEREKHHPLIHKIHKKYNISKKTLFYVKEYGPKSNVTKTIMKESIKIVLLASLISSLGGIVLENIKDLFVTIVPLIILLPVLNDMIGNYSIVVSSRFSTMLHEGKAKRKWWKIIELKELFKQIIIISLLTTIMSVGIAITASIFSSYNPSILATLKITLIAITDVIFLVAILFLVSIYAGFHFYRKKEDPNNFLIPITTSIADFGNMFILSILILLFF